MTLPTKTQASIVAILVAVSFGFGRYTRNQPASVTVKQDVKKEIDKNTVTDKKTVVVKEPTGQVTTTITEETRTDTKTNSDTKVSESIKASPQLQVSALAGIDIRTGIPVYGAAASKQILGPITVGAFGLTNGTVGVSIGMTF